MFLIDVASIALGIIALMLSPVLRYMFFAFIVATVCGFAFGARAGLLATQRWSRVGIIAGSVLSWLLLVWAAGIWWLNRYGS
jgi:hypothetical protein